MLHRDLRQATDLIEVQSQTPGAHRQLLQRFLSTDIQRRDPGRHRRQDLKQERGFSNPGIASYQDHRARHQTATQDPVEFRVTGQLAGLAVRIHAAENGHRAVSDAIGVTDAAATGGPLPERLHQRVPRLALPTLTAPFGGAGPALGAYVMSLSFATHDQILRRRRFTRPCPSVRP